MSKGLLARVVLLFPGCCNTCIDKNYEEVPDASRPEIYGRRNRDSQDYGLPGMAGNQFTDSSA